MKPIVTVLGPRDAGPGERELMLDRARRAFATLDIEDPTRVDVPPKGTAGEAGEGAMRQSIASLVPALQSGSLFGDRTGVLVVDAQHLLKAEAEVLADLVEAMSGDTIAVVFVAAGSIPAPLGKVLKDRGETLRVQKMRERDVGKWLAEEATDRGIKVDSDAAGELIQRFGSDVAAIGRALDQLAVGTRHITLEDVRGRFRNRPEEPVWLLGDAIAAGDQAEALRRLADYLQHDHPLRLLAYLESDLKKRAVAAVAPDIETFATWIGAKADAYPVRKAWQQRSRVKASDLARAVDALSRADLTLKTAPEEVHRVTLERLTVALCRWYGAGTVRSRRR